jgi:hypothetical protein
MLWSMVITMIDPDNPKSTKIYYNDPLLNENRSSYWLGNEGVRNAWKNNRDPGGSGWWMVIYSPKNARMRSEIQNAK